MSVPLVMYHALGDGPSPLWTPLDRFEAQIAAFQRAGYRTVTLGFVLDRLRRREPLPADALVLTFDDGYADVYHEAWPRLRTRGFTASLFVISDYCGRENRWPGQPDTVPRAQLMTWDQVSELAADGWEIGAHTCTHPALPGLPAASVEAEMRDSQRAVQARTGQAARVFAYPYGAADAASSALVRRYFDGAVTTNLGEAGAGADLHLLPRVDAYYLTPSVLRIMRGPLFPRYLRLRQLLRTVRRQVRRDWQPAAVGESLHV